MITPREGIGSWWIDHNYQIMLLSYLLYGLWNASVALLLGRSTSGKHKACLTIEGSKQCYGINYKETYLPVVTWIMIFLLYKLYCMAGIINSWILCLHILKEMRIGKCTWNSPGVLPYRVSFDLQPMSCSWSRTSRVKSRQVACGIFG